jgi:hypothetical protein
MAKVYYIGLDVHKEFVQMASNSHLQTPVVCRLARQDIKHKILP